MAGPVHWWWSETVSIKGAPPRMVEPYGWGNFNEQLWGDSPERCHRLVHERRIPFIKWGHLLRFDPLELAAWIASHRHGDCRTPPVALSSRRRSALVDPPRDS
jgi:hypothetical protein